MIAKEKDVTDATIMEEALERPIASLWKKTERKSKMHIIPASIHTNATL